MSGDETKLVDTSGDYQYVVRDGQPVEEPRWQSSRVVLTNKRLILANSDGNQSLPHGKVRLVADDDEILPADADTDTATPLRVGDNVILVDASGVDDFEREYCRADLDTEVILVKYPAVVGGVVQETEWSKARFHFADDQVKIALPGGDVTSFEVEDVGTIETTELEVMGQRRPVVQVEHTDEQDRSVETHFSHPVSHGSRGRFTSRRSSAD
ncbi:MAG: CheF family chemotaxis protein [Haloarculaceae archaeon]